METTPIDPSAESIKRYCPGNGLVVDNVVKLVGFAFNPRDD